MYLKWIRQKLKAFLDRITVSEKTLAISAMDYKNELIAITLNDVKDTFKYDNTPIDYEQLDALFANVMDSLSAKYLPEWTESYINVDPNLKKLRDLLLDELGEKIEKEIPNPVEKATVFRLIVDDLVDYVK